MLQLQGYKCRVLINRTEGVPVVFFHGLSYSSEVWVRIGVTDLLENKKIPFLALDMPYGIKSECKPKTRSTKKNLDFARACIKSIFGREKPLLVGASMGGNIALNYASIYAVQGLLLISPGRSLSEELVSSYPNFDFPVRIIWGAEDNIVSGEDMRVLSDKLPNGKLITYDEAGHSAYINQPENFRRDLLALYALAEQS
jgi:pimeloyl-ACP methyl ester carboxylesterase